MSNLNTNSQDYGATVLRVALGIMMLAHGLLKVNVFTVAGTVGFFESVNVPFATLAAYFTIGFEIAAGVALIAGVFVRLLSVISVPLMLGTIVFVHWNAGWLFSNTGGGWEYPAFLAAAFVAQAFLGKGAYALDLSKAPGAKSVEDSTGVKVANL